jgi:hypothetical protein
VNTDKFVSAVLSDGGATVSTHSELLPLSGFYVSDTDGAIVALDAFGASDVDAFVTRRASDLAAPGAYLGAWVSDGKVYLDVSRHFYSRDVALQVGASNDQLAVWDIANLDEIAVPSAA